MKHTLKIALAVVAIALAACNKEHVSPKVNGLQTTQPTDTVKYCKPCNDVGTVQVSRFNDTAFRYHSQIKGK